MAGARRALSTATLVVLLLLIAGLVVPGCSIGFNLSSDKPETGTKTFTDTVYGYSFDYPGDWVAQEGDPADVTAGNISKSGISVYDPEGAVADRSYIDLFMVSVYELAVTVDESMMPEVRREVERLLIDLEDQGDWTRTTDLADAAVGGIDGYQVTYTFTTDGVPTTSTFYFLFTGAIQYQLTLQAATKTWDQKQPDFEQIVESFKPGLAR